jgi:polyisoprenoid-binding protein YceI
MKAVLGLSILSFSIFLNACEDPAANKVRAVTSEASIASPGANPAAAVSTKGETLVLTPENSKVSFIGSKVTGRHDGGFNQFAGTIDLVNGEPQESGVRVEIETASVYTDADGLTKHLQTGDFFETGKFPKASFASTKVQPDTEKGANGYMVTGDLEIRGQKKTVTFPATIQVGTESVDVDAEFVIDRKDFGIVYAGKADDLIRDDVVIKLDLNSLRNR